MKKDKGDQQQFYIPLSEDEHYVCVLCEEQGVRVELPTEEAVSQHYQVNHTKEWLESWPMDENKGGKTQ